MSFDESMHPGGLRLTDRAARLAGIEPGMKLLDVGCGIGQSLEYLYNKFGIIPSGIDISEKAIAMARKRLPSAFFRVGDAAALPFKDASFDAVVSECVLSLLNMSEIKPASIDAISEIRRVLCPPGTLIISDVCEKDDLKNIQRRYEQSGFEVICFEEHNAALVTYAAEAYNQDARSSCFTEEVETACNTYNRATYYLMICKRN